MRLSFLLILALCVFSLASASLITDNWPSCVEHYTLNTFAGVKNFTYNAWNTTINCSGTTKLGYGIRAWGTMATGDYIRIEAARTSLVYTSTSAPWHTISNFTLTTNNTQVYTTLNSDVLNVSLGACSATGNVTISEVAGGNYRLNGSVAGDCTALPNINTLNISKPGVVTATGIYIGQFVNSSNAFDLLGQRTGAYEHFWTDEFYFSVNNGYIVRSDGITAKDKDDYWNNNATTSSPWFPAYLYYGSTQLRPRITYVLFTAPEAIPNLYNSTLNSAYMFNNTGAYVLDEFTEIWYFCPPYTFTSSPTNVTMSCIVAGTSSETYIAPVPVIATSQSCQPINATSYAFTWNGTVASSFYYQEQGYYANGSSYSNLTDLGSASYLSYNFTPSAGFTLAGVLVDGNKVCMFGNSSNSSIFTNTIFPERFGGALDFIPAIIITMALAIGTVAPFAVIFAVFVNDLFRLITPFQMVVCIAFTGLISVAANWHGQRNLKSLVMIMIIGMTAIIYLYTLAGIESGTVTQLSTKFSAMQSAFSNFDLVSIAIALPLFLLNLLLVVLSIPIIFVGVIVNGLMYVNPMLASVVNIILTPLAVAFYAYLALKAYEVVTKQVLMGGV